MDYFSQNEASQLVKTALFARTLKLRGIGKTEFESINAAKLDAAYMLALYRELLGPAGAAATMGDSTARAAQQGQIQQAMQAAVANVQQAPQFIPQPAPPTGEHMAPQQGQQNWGGAPTQQAFDAPGGQNDFRQYIPDAYRHHFNDTPSGS